MEDALQRLIEKKKEVEAKSVILHRTPSDIIKDAAQNALYARLRANPSNYHTGVFPTSPLSRFRTSFPTSRSPTPPAPMSPISHPKIEELPDDDGDNNNNHNLATSSTPLSPSPQARMSYTDFMYLDPPTQADTSNYAPTYTQWNGNTFSKPFHVTEPRRYSSVPPPTFSMFQDQDAMPTPGDSSASMDISPATPATDYYGTEYGDMGYQ